MPDQQLQKRGWQNIFSPRGILTLVALWMTWTWVSDFFEDRRRQRRFRERREFEARMRLEPKEWRLEELREFDGSDPQKPILLGVNGDVYNVWRGRDFYGKDGAYGAFAGRDASRQLAKNIVDESEDDGQPLGKEELESLRNWKEFFHFKYDHVGTLVQT
mmetsp:Transcript_98535/g.195458  ORF Transcript_98535/g.195458 Transcript_98535/m.195458 type:complete len:160 (+) Transcript_98535:126-605(+)|eukprot:CAMPEP_0172722548 /NCGR_PEP_ID=MMETSP1074-20121228/81745_1 /TAXON_ID=2916 /ORGANISM="Ceratium fusus, Strain PA161109" /LENGTH=159 /DNA_ID=CAMNT_0013548585 /DNA_START=122 /DNA_END=601 /DNA_ORIENTATION=+